MVAGVLMEFFPGLQLHRQHIQLKGQGVDMPHGFQRNGVGKAARIGFDAGIPGQGEPPHELRHPVGQAVIAAGTELGQLTVGHREPGRPHCRTQLGQCHRDAPAPADIRH